MNRVQKVRRLVVSISGYSTDNLICELGDHRTQSVLLGVNTGGGMMMGVSEK